MIACFGTSDTFLTDEDMDFLFPGWDSFCPSEETPPLPLTKEEILDLILEEEGKIARRSVF